MTAPTIRYSVIEGVASLSLCRPAQRNAMDAHMRDAFAEACNSAGSDPAVRVLLISAEGSSFCAGADTSEMGGGGIQGSRARMRKWNAMSRALNGVDKPVIAAVRGSAVGIGWSIVLGSDIVIASDTARFAQVFRNIALAPDGGAIWHLTRRLGVAVAKDLVFSGRFVAADEALKLGLVSRVVPDADLDATALSVAQELATGPTFALGMSKWLFDKAGQSSLDEFLELEMMVQSQLTQGQDFAEGIDAFKNKRKPKFTGR
ncbi:MAG: enoyl-CoA hydratase-related protein [Burkholderiaceae bacterium]|nr:enoyl-CoA hydratase-related protein [Burkholderiaceae bacterium]